jgi:cyclophilin family peptidyl-prolyl cis-trans isomerase
LSFLSELKSNEGGPYFGHNYGHVVRRNGQYLGYLMDLVRVAINEFGIEDAEVASLTTFANMAKTEPDRLARNVSKPTVFIEYSSDDPKGPTFGKIIIELFSDLCPNACNNFIKLCVGGTAGAGVAFHYLNNPIHRVVSGGWLQCGDIVDGSGANSVSSTGSPIEDECFSVDFGEKRGGILGYVSSAPHSNGSQFFITLGSCEFMNQNKVGFGRVLQGYDVLAQISTAPCRNQRPIPEIKISKCGKY